MIISIVDVMTKQVKANTKAARTLWSVQTITSLYMMMYKI